MRLVVWKESEEMDLIMVPLGHSLLPCGEETEQDTGPFAGQGPRGSWSHLALRHPHRLEESNSADKVLCLPLAP